MIIKMTFVVVADFGLYKQHDVTLKYILCL